MAENKSATTELSFTTQVDAWVRETQARMEAVFKGSAQDLIEKMQEVGPSVAASKSLGRAVNKAKTKKAKAKLISAFSPGTGHMPVDTGFLRASLVVALNQAPLPMTKSNDELRNLSYNSNVAALVVGGAKIGDRIVASYTANYAAHVEFGTKHMQPYGFVRLAVAQWPQIVAANIVKAKAAVAANKADGVA